MEQLEEGRLAIDSALESEVLGRAAARGADDGATQYFFKHPGYEYPARDELQFFDREQNVGRLVLTKRMAELAERGIDSIIASGKAFNGLTPNLAKAFRTAIDRSRADRLLQEVPAIPETDIHPLEAEAVVDVAAA
jgi:predicted RNase H-like nuclease